MPKLSERYTDILEPHIPDDESLKAWFRREGDDSIKLTAVTDRRVLEMSEEIGTDDREVSVESTLLTGEYVRGVTYGREDETEYPVVMYLVGSISAGIGVLLSLSSLFSTNLGGLLIGLLLVGLGVAFLYFAEDRDKGEVMVEVKLANGTESWRFPRGETDVPRAVSRVVAEQSAK